MFVNVATKSAQHAHARMITTVVEKSNSNNFLRPWFHGCNQNTNRQAVEKITLCTTQVSAAFTTWRQPFCIYTIFDCLAIGVLITSMKL